MATRLIFVPALLLLAAPAAAADLTPRERGDLAIRARGILNKHCAECHTGEKAPGRSQLPSLDHKALVSKAPPVPFVVPGDAGRSQLLQLIEDGSMPPGGRPRPSAEEIGVLKRWVGDAKAPGFPPAFGDRVTLGWMLDDFEKLHPDDQKHTRYISYAHLATDDGTPPPIAAAEARLHKGVHTHARPDVVSPAPVDPTATLYRIDLRKRRWNAPDLFDRVVGGRVERDAFPIVPFDLILLESPHAFALPRTDPFTPRLAAFFAETKPVRQVPFLRADWLGAVLGGGLADPLESPLARELADLARLADHIAAKNPEPEASPARPFHAAKPLRQKPVTPTGAASLLPLGAWYATDVSSDPPPFKLGLEIITPVPDEKPVGELKVPAQFNLRLVSERDATFALYSVLPDGTVLPRQVKSGNRVQGGTPLVLEPPGGGSFKIGSLLTGEPAETENFVLFASDGELPKVSVVRSRHVERHIWRFLPESGEKADAFDPRRVVRVVAPLRVVSAKP